jgi:predicted SprT family Zn-dependent metalloprotease
VNQLFDLDAQKPQVRFNARRLEIGLRLMRQTSTLLNFNSACARERGAEILELVRHARDKNAIWIMFGRFILVGHIRADWQDGNRT